MARLKIAEPFVLDFLTRNEGEWSVPQISDLVGLTPAAVYRAVGLLQRKGLVKGRVGRISTTFWSLVAKQTQAPTPTPD